MQLVRRSVTVQATFPPTFRKTEKDSLTDVTREWNLQAILLLQEYLPDK